MDESKKRAIETRRANEAARCEAIRREKEALAQTIEGLNLILTDPQASREERLKAGELIVEIKKLRY